MEPLIKGQLQVLKEQKHLLLVADVVQLVIMVAQAVATCAQMVVQVFV